VTDAGDPVPPRPATAAVVRPGAPPPDIVALAADRAAARAARDWARADELRAAIESSGWKVVDDGTRFNLRRAAPPDLVEGNDVRYGSAASVPSTLAEPATAAFTVELLADDWPADLTRCLVGLRTHAPAGTQAVVIANGPGTNQADRLRAGEPDLAPIGDLDVEVVRTSARLGHAAARNVGLRRARGAIVVLADTSIEVSGDALTPLAETLADPTVAVAGGFGIVSADLRRFEDSPGPEVDAVAGYWLAFRRDDLARLGPLDEKFTFYRSLDIWWSLVLRAGDGSSPPRRAVCVPLPLTRHEHRGWTSLGAEERDRLSRRNSYRVLGRFRDRADLLLSGAPSPEASPPGSVG
jgi:cysteinyl-tRNA synthetase